MNHAPRRGFGYRHQGMTVALLGLISSLASFSEAGRPRAPIVPLLKTGPRAWQNVQREGLGGRWGYTNRQPAGMAFRDLAAILRN